MERETQMLRERNANALAIAQLGALANSGRPLRGGYGGYGGGGGGGGGGADMSLLDARNEQRERDAQRQQDSRQQQERLRFEKEENERNRQHELDMRPPAPQPQPQPEPQPESTPIIPQSYNPNPGTPATSYYHGGVLPVGGSLPTPKEYGRWEPVKTPRDRIGAGGGAKKGSW